MVIAPETARATLSRAVSLIMERGRHHQGHLWRHGAVRESDADVGAGDH